MCNRIKMMLHSNKFPHVLIMMSMVSVAGILIVININISLDVPEKLSAISTLITISSKPEGHRHAQTSSYSTESTYQKSFRKTYWKSNNKVRKRTGAEKTIPLRITRNLQTMAEMKTNAGKGAHSSHTVLKTIKDLVAKEMKYTKTSTYSMTSSHNWCEDVSIIVSKEYKFYSYGERTCKAEGASFDLINTEEKLDCVNKQLKGKGPWPSEVWIAGHTKVLGVLSHIQEIQQNISGNCGGCGYPILSDYYYRKGKTKTQLLKAFSKKTGDDAYRRFICVKKRN